MMLQTAAMSHRTARNRHSGGRVLDEADCSRLFMGKGKLPVGRRLKYSLCKRVWPRAYTRHILSDASLGEEFTADTPTYRGHALSKERRRGSELSRWQESKKVKKGPAFFSPSFVYLTDNGNDSLTC